MSFENKAVVEACKIDYSSIPLIDPNDIIIANWNQKITINFGIEVMFVLTIQL